MPETPGPLAGGAGFAAAASSSFTLRTASSRPARTTIPCGPRSTRLGLTPMSDSNPAAAILRRSSCEEGSVATSFIPITKVGNPRQNSQYFCLSASLILATSVPASTLTICACNASPASSVISVCRTTPQSCEMKSEVAAATSRSAPSASAARSLRASRAPKFIRVRMASRSVSLVVSCRARSGSRSQLGAALKRNSGRRELLLGRLRAGLRGAFLGEFLDEAAERRRRRRWGFGGGERQRQRQREREEEARSEAPGRGDRE